jgi:exocyst complex component 4
MTPSTEHSQTFAAALPHHASVLASLNAAQKQIAEAKSTLLETSEAFDNKRADLVQLWQRGQALEEMMKLLDEMYVST